MRPQGLDAVAKRVRRLVPRRATPSRRLSLAVAVVVIVIAAGAAAVLGLRDAGARREVCAAKERWAGKLTTALADPKRRTLLTSDPDLARVVRELDQADLASFDCDRSAGRFGFNPNLRKFRQTQDTLDAVRRAERGLSPIQWRQLARAAELQGRFEARGWKGPARHLADCIAGARPGSGDLAAGIERFLVALAGVDRNLPAVEERWLALQARTRGLEDTRDKVMKAFAAHLRSAAAASVTLSDAGFGGLEGVDDASARAQSLVDAHQRLGPQYDEERFRKDIVDDIDRRIPNQVRTSDIDRYLQGMPAYRVQEVQIKEAVAKLKQEMADTEKAVRGSAIDPKQTKEFEGKLRWVNGSVSLFGDRKFIPRDLDDGQFKKDLEQVAADVASLRDFIPIEKVEEWLKRLRAEPLGVGSRALGDYWEEWRDRLPAKARDLAARPTEITDLQSRTRRVRDVLLALDRAVQAPRQLDDEVLAKAAEVKREEVLAGLLKDPSPAALARDVDAAQKVRDSVAIQTAAASFKQWTDDLAELGKEFPLRQRILTPDVRPDEKWAAAKPAFWNDRIVQSLVEADVARLKRLREIEAKSRDELIELARKEDREEVALHAWRLLGTKAEPAWPTRAGELATEAALRDRVGGMVAKYAASDEGARATRELAEDAPRRWRRFAEAAGVDEAMLASAVELRDAFGVSPEQFASLPAEVRFNLSLLEVRQHLRDTSDAALTRVVADLTTAANELKDRGVAADLGRRLARVGETEPFADVARGDEFTLQPAGADVRIVFKRIKPQGRRPFFLAVTEVSFGQFAGVIEAASAWDPLRALVWSPQPGEIGDPRRGPRSWEWVMRPAPRMYPPQWWLFPEDANDFPKELRDPATGKFNRTVLGDAAGGTPSNRHPVQYLTPEAMMYVASLVGCRLPTPSEWRAAYDAYEKGVPTAQWNLRDETWRVQRDHVAALAGGGAGNHAPQAPDEGIYLPPKGATPVASGAEARALPQRDGTLYFRPADAPGGSTFRQLVGNVAEVVCDASEPFEQLKDRTPPKIKSFAAEPATGLFVIGGSALSPPEVPVDSPQAVKPGAAYADVGFRLAFTAPSKNLAEKLEWVLAGQGFVRPGAESKTASAEKNPPAP